MKNKMLARRIAIAMLSAGMVVSTVPVSTFAADAVSVEASDASTNISGLSSSVSEADQTTIKDKLAAASVTATVKSTDKTIADGNVTGIVSLPTNYSITNYKILSATAPAMKETASGYVLVKPILHIQADVLYSGAARGTVTFDTEAGAMTTTEKIAALKTLLATVGGSSSDATTRSNNK